MTHGMAINSGNVSKKHDLVLCLRHAAVQAGTLDLYIDGRMFALTLLEVAAMVEHNAFDTVARVKGQADAAQSS